MSKTHKHHLHQNHLLTCTAHTIIAKHKQIGNYLKVTCCHTYRPQLIEHVQKTIVADHTPLQISTLTPTTLANPSSTQGSLVFIRHPELNSRDVIPSSTQGMPRAKRLKNAIATDTAWRNSSYRQAHALLEPIGLTDTA
ncbi:hypothetical protein DEO72_LG1g2339 [Vigna unguiculata]|uniref:Uncharacterized protein n=1 Tax=Vigna unguiculata TaxID=3917 RepID=A0A4D6KQC0_VIGUN|nr:hypothetical protein DEO72_LG1g2339 [Vigna unguiculata]